VAQDCLPRMFARALRKKLDDRADVGTPPGLHEWLDP
jgi:hypothetical protein